MPRGKKNTAEMPDNLEQQRGEVAMMPLRLIGTESLVVHQWGQKSVIELLSKMTGHNLVQLPKDLTKEYEQSAYRNDRDEHVMPCRIIKAVGVAGAVSSGKAIKKAELNRGLRVMGHAAPIKGVKPEMDTRMVRVGGFNGKPDVRARTLYPAGWYLECVLRFYPAMISPQKVVHVFRLAGEDIGFCEMRIEKGFSYGAFEVESVKESEVKRILKECSSPEKMFQIPPALLRAAGNVKQTRTSKRVTSLVESVNGAPDRHEANGAPNGVTRRRRARAEEADA
jgi:hypothetical protein